MEKENPAKGLFGKGNFKIFDSKAVEKSAALFHPEVLRHLLGLRKLGLRNLPAVHEMLDDSLWTIDILRHIESGATENAQRIRT